MEKRRDHELRYYVVCVLVVVEVEEVDVLFSSWHQYPRSLASPHVRACLCSPGACCGHLIIMVLAHGCATLSRYLSCARPSTVCARAFVDESCTQSYPCDWLMVRPRWIRPDATLRSYVG